MTHGNPINHPRNALAGMALAISVVTGIFLLGDLLAPTPATTERLAIGPVAPVDAPIFIVTAEFRTFAGWTPEKIANAIRDPFAGLGVVVALRPELQAGGGLYNGGSYEFAMLVARTFHTVIKPQGAR